MNGALCLVPLYVFKVWTGKVSPCCTSTRTMAALQKDGIWDYLTMLCEGRRRSNWETSYWYTYVDGRVGRRLVGFVFICLQRLKKTTIYYGRPTAGWSSNELMGKQKEMGAAYSRVLNGIYVEEPKSNFSGRLLFRGQCSGGVVKICIDVSEGRVPPWSCAIWFR